MKTCCSMENLHRCIHRHCNCGKTNLLSTHDIAGLLRFFPRLKVSPPHADSYDSHILCFSFPCPSSLLLVLPWRLLPVVRTLSCGMLIMK